MLLTKGKRPCESDPMLFSSAIASRSASPVKAMSTSNVRLTVTVFLILLLFLVYACIERRQSMERLITPMRNLSNCLCLLIQLKGLQKAKPQSLEQELGAQCILFLYQGLCCCLGRRPLSAFVWYKTKAPYLEPWSGVNTLRRANIITRLGFSDNHFAYAFAHALKLSYSGDQSQ